MATDQQSFVQNIQALFDAGAIGELTDRQLLERLKADDRDAAELAFAVLVRRHGPMVFRACCSIVRDRHEAEDAFQATFLILYRKVGSLWLRDSIGPWLYGVACRVASCARSAAIRRRALERKSAERVKLTVDDASWDDRDSVLREELGRLPIGYQMAVVLCDLEGLTHEQAARQLGWPAGTVRSRLARGRDRLRDRLSRRGLAPAVVPMGAWRARDSVPASLTTIAVENALRFAAREGASGTMASAIALMEGALRVMFVSKLKLITALGLAGGVLIGGGALVGHGAIGRAQVAPAAVKLEPGRQNGLQEEPAAIAPIGTDALSPSARARLDVARKLRDTTYTLYREGESTLTNYLNSQRHLDEVESDLLIKTPADRVRYQEGRVTRLRELEHLLSGQVRAADASSIEKLTIESERLEAEEALAKAKARLAVGADAAKARLKVAEKLRDVMRLQFEGGLGGVEEYLVWQKRYDSLARDVMLLTGGNRKQLLENQLTAMTRLEQDIERRFAEGTVQQSAFLKVEYYRLEIEEALARAQAESEISPGKD
jgi:RNA polymerase sigma factor (sigma-70 family)